MMAVETLLLEKSHRHRPKKRGHEEVSMAEVNMSQWIPFPRLEAGCLRTSRISLRREDQMKEMDEFPHDSKSIHIRVWD